MKIAEGLFVPDGNALGTCRGASRGSCAGDPAYGFVPLNHQWKLGNSYSCPAHFSVFCPPLSQLTTTLSPERVKVAAW